MLAPATTRDFSDLLKKLQVTACSIPVAGCVILQTEYMMNPEIQSETKKIHIQISVSKHWLYLTVPLLLIKLC